MYVIGALGELLQQLALDHSRGHHLPDAIAVVGKHLVSVFELNLVRIETATLRAALRVVQAEPRYALLGTAQVPTAAGSALIRE